ncbi:hypothetical protein D3C78_1972980 [compost metagenome]
MTRLHRITIMPALLEVRIPARVIDIDRQHPHAMFARVPHQLRGSVKAHRLRV